MRLLIKEQWPTVSSDSQGMTRDLFCSEQLNSITTPLYMNSIMLTIAPYCQTTLTSFQKCETASLTVNKPYEVAYKCAYVHHKTQAVFCRTAVTEVMMAS